MPRTDAGPGDAAGAGVLGDPPLRVQDMELAVVHPRVGADQFAQHRRRVFPRAQPGHRGDGVHRVHQRLGGERGDPALHREGQRADGEETGGDGGAERAGRGIADEKGIRHSGMILGGAHEGKGKAVAGAVMH